ncbi:MAG: hypothetical protein JSR86_15210 [Proteobacteria bacterium]|nr:hypothetical protein [Pseudomonadota bacterium]
MIAIAATVLTFELAIVLLGPAMSNDDEAQAKIALQDFSNALDTIAAADLAHPPTIDTKPKATGQVGVLEGVVMTYLATVLDDRIKYQAELKEAGAGAFLKPSTLAADPGLRHAQQTVTRLHSIVAKYRGLSDARLAQVRDAIARSSLNDRLKAQFNIGVARSSAQNDEARHRLWDMEAKLVDDYGQIVQGLAHPHGRWIASGNAIRFSNNQDLSEYNARIADVRDLVQQQRQLQAGAMARTRALLKTQQDSFN